MTLLDILITVGVLLLIALIVYTKFRKQSLKETATEIKEIFSGT